VILLVSSLSEELSAILVRGHLMFGTVLFAWGQWQDRVLCRHLGSS
jgi:hypothetical protein